MADWTGAKRKTFHDPKTGDTIHATNPQQVQFNINRGWVAGPSPTTKAFLESKGATSLVELRERQTEERKTAGEERDIRRTAEKTVKADPDRIIHTESGDMTQRERDLQLLGPAPAPADFFGSEPVGNLEDYNTAAEARAAGFSEEAIRNFDRPEAGEEKTGLAKFFEGEGEGENIYDEAIRKADERRLRRAQESADYFAAIEQHRLEKELIERQNDAAFFAAIEARKFLLDKEEQKTETVKWEKIEEERKEVKAKERLDDEAYYDNIAEEKRTREEEQRKEDEIYWEQVKAINKAEKAAQRKADEEYWANIKAQNTPEPWTPADSKVVSDWNAGKSALNFAWLGL